MLTDFKKSQLDWFTDKGTIQTKVDKARCMFLIIFMQILILDTVSADLSVKPKKRDIEFK